MGAGFVAYAVAERKIGLLAPSVAVAAAIFVVGLVALSLASNAELASIGPGGGASTLSSLGITVAFRVAPTIGYALVLATAAVLFRLRGLRV
jgi:hypothetical protein